MYNHNNCKYLGFNTLQKTYINRLKTITEMSNYNLEK